MVDMKELNERRVSILLLILYTAQSVVILMYDMKFNHVVFSIMAYFVYYMLWIIAIMIVVKNHKIKQYVVTLIVLQGIFRCFDIILTIPILIMCIIGLKKGNILNKVLCLLVGFILIIALFLGLMMGISDVTLTSKITQVISPFDKSMSVTEYSIDQGALGIDFKICLEKNIFRIVTVSKRVEVRGVNARDIVWSGKYNFKVDGRKYYIIPLLQIKSQ